MKPKKRTDLIAAEISIIEGIISNTAGDIAGLCDLDPAAIYSTDFRAIVTAAQKSLMARTDGEPVTLDAVAANLDGGIKALSAALAWRTDTEGDQWVPSPRATEIIQADCQKRQGDRLQTALSSAVKAGDKDLVVSSALAIANFAEKNGVVEKYESIFRPVASYPDNVPEPEYLVANLIPAESLGFFAGQAKQARKTTQVTALSVAVAHGGPWLGQSTKAGKVLFVAAEESEHAVLRRINWIIRGLQADRDVEMQIRSNLMVACGPRPFLTSPEGQAELMREVGLHRPSLVILDPLTRIFSGDENSRDLEPLMDFLKRLFFQFKCSVLIVHHSAKAAASDPNADPLRGHSCLRAAHDFLFDARPMPSGNVLVKYEGRYGQHRPFVVDVNFSESTESITFEVEAPEHQPNKQESIDEAFKILDLLKLHSDGMSQNGIARTVGKSPATIRKILDRLEAAGQVEKTKIRETRSNGRSFTMPSWKMINSND